MPDTVRPQPTLAEIRAAIARAWQEAARCPSPAADAEHVLPIRPLAAVLSSVV